MLILFHSLALTIEYDRSYSVYLDVFLGAVSLSMLLLNSFTIPRNLVSSL